MKEYRSGWNKKSLWAVSIVLLLAAGLFVAALTEPKQQSSDNWVQLNRSVEAALQQDEQELQGDQGTTVDKDEEEDQEKDRKDKGSQLEQLAGEIDDPASSNTSGSQSDVKDALMIENTDTSVTNSAMEDGKLDINRATAEQLDSLKGIGPAKAQAIVEDRNVNGKFSSVGDLQRVKGIGPKLLEGVKDSIVARP